MCQILQYNDEGWDEVFAEQKYIKGITWMQINMFGIRIGTGNEMIRCNIPVFVQFKSAVRL